MPPQIFQDNPLPCSFSLQLIFFQNSRFTEIIRHQILMKHCNFSHLASKTVTRSICTICSEGERENIARGGTPTYGLYRYVPRNRVWFLRFSVLKQGQGSRTFAAHPYPKFAGVPPPGGIHYFAVISNNANSITYSSCLFGISKF